MALVWDSSAVLALVFEEKGTPLAMRAWESDPRHVAWRWMIVETHAALVRRGATATNWADWQWRMDRFDWTELSPSILPHLMKANTDWKLRSADAGHVYLFEELLSEGLDISLVTFDREMRSLCKVKGWPLWNG